MPVHMSETQFDLFRQGKKSRARRPEGREQALVNSCLRWLHYRGIWAHRQNTGAQVAPATATTKRRFVRYGIPGAADITGCIPQLGGRRLEVECKIRPNKPTQEQLRYLDDATRAGAIAIVVYTLDDLVAALEPLLRPDRT